MSISFPELAARLNWQFTEGSEFLWKCWGPNCRYCDFEIDNQQISAIFDTKTLWVNKISGYYHRDNTGVQQPWCWIEPAVKDAYLAECKQRRIDPWTAWDNIKFEQIDDDEFVWNRIEESQNAQV